MGPSEGRGPVGGFIPHHEARISSKNRLHFRCKLTPGGTESPTPLSATCNLQPILQL